MSTASCPFKAGDKIAPRDRESHPFSGLPWTIQYCAPHPDGLAHISRTVAGEIRCGSICPDDWSIWGPPPTHKTWKVTTEMRAPKDGESYLGAPPYSNPEGMRPLLSALYTHSVDDVAPVVVSVEEMPEPAATTMPRVRAVWREPKLGERFVLGAPDRLPLVESFGGRTEPTWVLEVDET